MTKSDLKTGMIVESRNGYKYIVLLNHMGEYDILFNVSLGEGFVYMGGYNDNLLFESDSDWDIMKIYKRYGLGSSFLSDFNEIIWERPIKAEVTLEEIAQWKGVNIKDLRIKD